MRYDLIVLGGDPIAVETAVHEARRGLYVAIVDAVPRVDPAAVPTVDVVRGRASFERPHVLRISRYDDVLRLEAERFVIATDDVADFDLESIGVGFDEMGRPWCDAEDRTWVEPIEVLPAFASIAPSIARCARIGSAARTNTTSRPADAVLV